MDRLGKNYIPTRLDTPRKILFWEIDTVIVFLLPIWLFGFVLKQLLAAGLLAYVFVTFFKKFKSSSHPKFLKHFLYWYLPQELGGIKAKSLPKSHIRSFLS